MESAPLAGKGLESAPWVLQRPRNSRLVRTRECVTIPPCAPWLQQHSCRWKNAAAPRSRAASGGRDGYRPEPVPHGETSRSPAAATNGGTPVAGGRTDTPATRQHAIRPRLPTDPQAAESRVVRTGRRGDAGAGPNKAKAVPRRSPGGSRATAAREQDERSPGNRKSHSYGHEWETMCESADETCERRTWAGPRASGATMQEWKFTSGTSGWLEPVDS